MEKLPLKVPVEQIETRAVLKQLAETRAALAKLQGISLTIPNENILIDTLILQEAKESSAIENIVTTHDELYKSNFQVNEYTTAAAKEVYAYTEAVKMGYNEIQKTGLISTNLILRIQQLIEQNDAGFRKLPGTALKNEQTGETIYTPPQHPDEIAELIDNLVWFINEPTAMDVDPLVKMAIIHHQFESIHPFYNGNGRTGRIINVLFLLKEELLSLPILYMSRFIIEYRQTYYQLLQTTRETGDWEAWVMYMLTAIRLTAKETYNTILEIKLMMYDYKNKIRTKARKIYSQDLLNNLFRHPYTKIALLQNELKVSRPTARKYLERLTKMGLLNKVKVGRDNYYVNEQLVELLKG